VTSKPRLLFLGPLPEPTTGQSLACKVLLDGLRNDYDVDVVDLNKKTFKQGVSSFGRIGEVISMIARAARKQRDVDLIYFTISESFAGLVKDLAIYAVCWRKLPRMIVHLHGGAGMRLIMAGKYGLASRLNRIALQRLGAMVVLGPRLATMYGGAIESGRIHSVANFAPEAVFLDDAAIAAKVAQTGPIRLLFLSNLLPGKGYSELLDAFISLSAEQRAAFRVDFAGGFEDEVSRADFCARIRAIREIKYHGIVAGEAKRALFAGAHIFCLPTYYPYEGQPISLLEAYASGAVVITTDHSGIFDVFTDGVNGYAVEKGSVTSLAAALTRLTTNRSALAAIGQTNRLQAETHYREHHFVARMRQVFDSVQSRDQDADPRIEPLAT
jgi:glycosyltransferase involved in cell wall biosynthesis